AHRFLFDRKIKRASAAELRLHPYPAIVAAHDALAHRKTHPAAGVLLLVVQSFKHLEDSVVILRGDPDAVVRNRETPGITLSLAGDLNEGGRRTAVFNRVANEIQNEADQLGWVPHDLWK